LIRDGLDRAQGRSTGRGYPRQSRNLLKPRQPSIQLRGLTQLPAGGTDGRPRQLTVSVTAGQAVSHRSEARGLDEDALI